MRDGAVRGRRGEASTLDADLLTADGFGGEGGGAGKASKSRAVLPASKKGRTSWTEDDPLELTDEGRAIRQSTVAVVTSGAAASGTKGDVGCLVACCKAKASRRTPTSCSTSTLRSFSRASSSSTSWSSDRSTTPDATEDAEGDDVGVQSGVASKMPME